MPIPIAFADDNLCDACHRPFVEGDRVRVTSVGIALPDGEPGRLSIQGAEPIDDQQTLVEHVECPTN